MIESRIEQEVKRRWEAAQAAIADRRDRLYRDVMSRAFKALLQGDTAERTRILNQTHDIDRQADNAKREAIARIMMELVGMDEDNARELAAKVMTRAN